MRRFSGRLDQPWLVPRSRRESESCGSSAVRPSSECCARSWTARAPPPTASWSSRVRPASARPRSGRPGSRWPASAGAGAAGPGRGADAQLSFAALIDLLDEVPDEELAGLPEPQRRALEVALLRAEPDGAPPEPHAIALAFLDGLRAAGGEAPLLVAIDDVQWLDPPSVEALLFAARRLEGTASASCSRAAAARLAAWSGRWGATALQPARRRPAHLRASRRLLRERLGADPAAPPAAPRLRDHPREPAVRARARARAAGARPAGDRRGAPAARGASRTCWAPASPAPGAPAPAAAGRRAERRPAHRPARGAHRTPSAARDAVDAGLLVVDGDRVRASHPLLAAAARRARRAGERRELHRALADVVTGEELRALHLALASERPDAALAATLATRRRDAPSPAAPGPRR